MNNIKWRTTHHLHPHPRPTRQTRTHHLHQEPPHKDNNMPTRNAEEADLSNASQERSNSCQKTTPDSDDTDVTPPSAKQPQADKNQPDQGDKMNIPNLDAVHYLTTTKPNLIEVQG